MATAVALPDLTSDDAEFRRVVLGLVIVASVYVSIIAALISMRELRREFDLLEPEHRNPFDVIRIPCAHSEPWRCMSRQWRWGDLDLVACRGALVRRRFSLVKLYRCHVEPTLPVGFVVKNLVELGLRILAPQINPNRLSVARLGERVRTHRRSALPPHIRGYCPLQPSAKVPESVTSLLPSCCPNPGGDEGQSEPHQLLLS